MLPNCEIEDRAGLPYLRIRVKSLKDFAKIVEMLYKQGELICIEREKIDVVRLVTKKLLLDIHLDVSFLREEDVVYTIKKVTGQAEEPEEETNPT